MFYTSLLQVSKVRRARRQSPAWVHRCIATQTSSVSGRIVRPARSLARSLARQDRNMCGASQVVSDSILFRKSSLVAA
jgi:hypothetical protein